MKKIIQEQTVPKPQNLVGKTVNFYNGFQQNQGQLVGTFKVDKVSKRNERNVDVDITDTKNGKKLRFFIPCNFVNDDKPELKGLMDITGNFKESELRFYNLQFVDALKPWCVAPKVDFASTDTQSSEPMTEGKKVIRLTESDLVGLVKKVLNEEDDDKHRLHNRIRGDFEQYRMINSHISRTMDELYGSVKQGRENNIENNKGQLIKLLKRAEETINELKRNITRL